MSLEGKFICYTALSNMYWIIIYTTCKVLIITRSYALLRFSFIQDEERKKLIFSFSKG